MSNFNTPGININESNKLPLSVAQVSTAIPAFIGYTEKADRNSQTLINKAVRISSFVEYTLYFGEAFPEISATLVLNNDQSVASVRLKHAYHLFNGMRMFYNQGGGDCYIISVGLYKKDGTADILDFIDPNAERCLDILRKEDEPTLIIIPDAVMLPESDFNRLMNETLKQCGELQDRFTILDILNGDQERTNGQDDVITKFRDGIETDLKYGAAYYPWLRTSLQFKISFANINLTDTAGNLLQMESVIGLNKLLKQLEQIRVDQQNIIVPFTNTLSLGLGRLQNSADLDERITDIGNMLLHFIELQPLTDTVAASPNGNTIQKIFDQYTKPGKGNNFSPVEKLIRELILIKSSYPQNLPVLTNNVGNFGGGYQLDVVADPLLYGNLVPALEKDAIQHIAPMMQALFQGILNLIAEFKKEVEQLADKLEQDLFISNNEYHNIKMCIINHGMIVPPAAAMAGIYASVDNARGVWKAPANVLFNTIIEPTVHIDVNMQADLNVDVIAGKSINTIREFAGIGTLVWGARTLAGNDNEWRYISVRRFIIMVEESLKNATNPFVFEPNNVNTWSAIKNMISNFLITLWRQGALQGAKPSDAFFVSCGIGESMSADDILNGKLIVTVGLAVARPAEFIILSFMHKMQSQ